MTGAEARQTAVKICGLTNAADALQAWRAGADLLGLVFAPTSPRCVTPHAASRIVRQLRDAGCTVPLVGVFAGRSLHWTREVAEACGLDLVQWHGPDPLPDVVAVGRPVILAHRVRSAVPWEALADERPWAHLLDAYVPGALGGTGTSWDLALLGGRRTAGRVLIAGGLTPATVARAVALARPWGVDVSSGVELAPGRKDPAAVSAFIARAREVDTRHG